MITLYGMSSPNVQKILIMLEELELPYEYRRVNVWEGENYTPAFTKLNPARKVPVLVDDRDPGGKTETIFESGAILFYLAERSGCFLPASGTARYDCMQWLMVQMAGVGPMFGQYSHFLMNARDNTYALNRYRTQAARFYEVLDLRLAEVDYLAGEYSIADMAVFPWTRDRNKRWGGNWEQNYTHVAAWHARIKARPALQRLLPVFERIREEDEASIRAASAETKDRYYGKGVYTVPS